MRQSLARNLTWLILVTSGAIAVVSFVTGRRVVSELSADLIAQRIDHTELALREYFQPIETVLFLYRDWAEDGLLASVDHDALDAARRAGSPPDLASLAAVNRHVQPMMERLRRVTSLLFADTRGRELLVLRGAEGWSNRVVDADRWGPEALVVAPHERGAPLESRWQNVGYDPRTRPWMTGAIALADDEAVHWTEPYRFFTTQAPGITASVRWRDPRDPGTVHVIAFDVLLRDLSAFTTSLDISPRGVAMIATEDGRVAGLPRDPRFASPEGIRTHVLTPIRELEVPELHDAIRAWDEKLIEPGAIFSFQSGSEPWWAAVRAFPLGEQDFRIAVLAPQADFLEGVHAQRRNSAIILLAALAGSFAIAAQLARRYSQPLAALAEQAARIEHLDVDSGVRVSSRVRELDQLASTQERMRTALDSFARYVPIDVVRELMRRNQAATIGGSRREITVLFTDIQGFTTIAESLDPETLTHHMSGYFEAMLGTVQSDGFGEVTQLTGDGFVAFWGAPVECGDHAARAMESVLRCRERLATLNRGWVETGRPALPTRFGLATGSLIVGNVGSPARLVYTAVGDTINLASRLEGMNRFYGTWVLVSEATRVSAGDAYAWRRLDRVRAKGKAVAIDLYELLGRAAEVDAPTLDCVRRYERALDRYMARAFDEAEAALEALLADHPGDPPAGHLLTRVREMRVDPPPADWDGVHVYDIK